MDQDTDQTETAIEATYRTESPASLEQFERDCESMPGGAKGAYYYGPYPLTMQRGEGCYLFDIDERRRVDFANHHTGQILGHNNAAVNEAVQAQLERGIALGAPTGNEAGLAEELCSRVVSLERVRFCNSGTEATLHAIRLARGFSRRPKIAKFEGGYHGSHDPVEVSVAPPVEEAGPADAPHSVATAGGMSPSATDEVIVLPYNNEEAVERIVRSHRDELACVILDPKTGILPVRKEFVQAVRRITEENEVLLILDEVVGFRVTRGGCQEHFGISPDLSAFGKVVGGGFPVGALGGRADIMALFDNSGDPTGFFQSGTFSAHAVVMAAGLATLRQLTPEAFAHMDGLSERLRAGLDELSASVDTPFQGVVLGSLFSVYFTEEPLVDYRSLASSDGAMAHRVFLSLLNQGYYLSQGLSMNALSLPMTDEHIDGLLLAFERALEEARA
ncbi:MAG: aspartate aminotransferase family protein [Caldilineaceae bacterium]|nr:aspartate aminotransferase family protein [Caldilineaceae bacterium]